MTRVYTLCIAIACAIALMFATSLFYARNSNASPGDVYAYAQKHERAINAMRTLIVRVCAFRQFEDYSIVDERNDNVRFACAKFVNRINR